MIMALSGPVFGGSVTMQREIATQNDQEKTVIKKDMNRASGDQLEFVPRRLHDKKDSGSESGKGLPAVSVQRYKPSEKGEGQEKPVSR